MRIFYAVANSPNSQLRSNLWRQNLRGSLVKLGHEIVDFEYDLDHTFQYLNPSDPAQREFIDRNRPRLSDALLAQVRRTHAKQHLDLFFSYFYNACVEPGVIREIGSLGITTTNWFCNASYQFQLVAEIAPEYNFCLVPEKFRLEDYRRVGANPIYCQEAANPQIYRPHPVRETYDAGFVGQAYGERPALIEWLAEQRVDVHVWGQGWEYFQKRRPSLFGTRCSKKNGAPRIPARLIGGILSDEELVRTFSRTRVNLGFAACWTDENAAERITQIRLRDFEVPMSGGFYLTEHQDELEGFFEIDSEIACYRNKDELLEKTCFYLKHPDLRDRIRNAGRRRCLRDHTWEKRFEAAFKRMELRT